MSVSLYDTYSRKVKPILPSRGDTLGFYCCGPTVYAPAHIGNLRTFVLQDVFRRVYELDGGKIKHVRNLTDVDDKTIRQSREAGLPIRDLTAKWTSVFHDDCEELNLLPPHHEPAATDHIPEQIDLVKNLILKGHAYATPNGSVYFKIASFKDYGKLSRLGERTLRTADGAAADGSKVDSDEYEQDVGADFALWKGKKEEDGDVYWDSPWGRGRPGWHLECSAMSMKYLGESFDMHGGGIDLLFPHHENEVAQSEACTCRTFVHHWFHCAHLMVEGRKMSKSLGNLYTLSDLKEKGVAPRTLRYVLITGHYRQPLNFTWDTLHSAESALTRLDRAADRLAETAGIGPDSSSAPAVPAPDSVFARAFDALRQDLNTPAALGELFKALNQLEKNDLERDGAAAELRAFHGILHAMGLTVQPAGEPAPQEVPGEIQALADERWQRRQAKDWSGADQLRNELSDAGWDVLDSKEGYVLKPKSRNSQSFR